MDLNRFAAVHCSVARASGIVADPWALLILRDLFLGIYRYDELRRDLGIATNVLADRLDRLVEREIVLRRAYQHNPIRYEYRLTEAGRDLYGVILTLMAWGDRHLAPDGAPLRMVHLECGEQTVPTVSCDQCGGRLTPDTVRIEPGPDGRAAPGTAIIATRLAR